MYAIKIKPLTQRQYDKISVTEMRMPEHLTLLFMHRPAILGGGQWRLRFVNTAMSIQTRAIFNTSKIGAIRGKAF